MRQPVQRPHVLVRVEVRLIHDLGLAAAVAPGTRGAFRLCSGPPQRHQTRVVRAQHLQIRFGAYRLMAVACCARRTIDNFPMVGLVYQRKCSTWHGRRMGGLAAGL